MMSQANMPNITPLISITQEQSAILLLSSIALQEMALAHIVNAEAEKIQYILGTLESPIPSPSQLTIEELLKINDSVRDTMYDVILNEMLLLMKFSEVKNVMNKIAPC